MNKRRKEEISQAARELHKGIWRDRHIIWKNGYPVRADGSPDLLRMLSPEIVCGFLGVQYDELGEIPNTFPDRFGQKYKTAGFINIEERKIGVDASFPIEQVRFTAIHEIGHLQLHSTGHGLTLHRDKPITMNEQTSRSRPEIEKEADYYSACFLMPEIAVREYFEKTFGLKSPVHFNEQLAQALAPEDFEVLLRAEQGTHSRELAFASCDNFNWIPMHSLAQQFGVSSGSMAIRLSELSMINWP